MAASLPRISRFRLQQLLDVNARDLDQVSSCSQMFLLSLHCSWKHDKEFLWPERLDAGSRSTSVVSG